MNDYISREDVKDALLGWDYDPSDEDVEFAINQIPAADVVEVVRCKDCKHAFKLKGSSYAKESPYRYYRENSIMCGCEALMGDMPEAVLDDFYCGYGERREE